ncbi:ABC transporter ATP-binding protein [Paenibacillus sp. FSL M8-0228]|jgi:peptide/nickel transport system ATP-binding protein|uniref:ABC transporter ATP-binding protein n=1 Tax=Paenibacillus TaxID=44249 RepID=UPI00083DC5FA|nr:MULTISPECIES: ABC transporter ATP-binding protein [Paenibacillus]MBO3284770.1 ABC transporter ATP-binding protein [Paenibacillus polymyxa]MBP1311937.1 peptide/nickel transport system ATP-binding protein [Paenibacillus sp. 1182]MDY8092825.1 ABC transporter ATP-binding protein [Paenibacillus polymyxa]ODB53270.1 dipeptide/oligopeptide/nickel ABC transporter ATP-binding protein [Paenibacillus polymyxa]
MKNALIEFRNLKTHFHTSSGTVKAVNDVSFKIREGETLCVVGESGCGKSVTAMTMMRLIDSPHTSDGEIWFEGKNLLTLNKGQMQQIRGNDISIIFQEPMSSLNPVLTIGEQITEPLLMHTLMSKREAHARAIELINLVGISRSEEIFHSYPHELSGGMRQRIMIAIALSCNPKLLIADEPTTALDVTIQAQILDLMRDLKDKLKTSIMLITHDLGVVAEMADYVVVMYAGNVIEEAPVIELFKNPQHPYTQGLLKAKPVINQKMDRLYSIPGQVPNPIELGENCHFHDRCSHCMQICKDQAPPLNEKENGHKVACWLYEKEGGQRI